MTNDLKEAHLVSQFFSHFHPLQFFVECQTSHIDQCYLDLAVCNAIRCVQQSATAPIHITSMSCHIFPALAYEKCLWITFKLCSSLSSATSMMSSFFNKLLISPVYCWLGVEIVVWCSVGIILKLKFTLFGTSDSGFVYDHYTLRKVFFLPGYSEFCYWISLTSYWITCPVAAEYTNF